MMCFVNYYYVKIKKEIQILNYYFMCFKYKTILRGEQLKKQREGRTEKMTQNPFC